VPLTRSDVWRALDEGEIIVVRQGQVLATGAVG
jgi:predicted glutamine amidotransferase